MRRRSIFSECGDVHIGPADEGLQDADEHIVAADVRNWNFLEAQPRLFTTACIIFGTTRN